MKEQEKLQLVWKKYLPLITMKLKQVVRNSGSTSFGMYKFEFHGSGSKKKAVYQFNLELKEGRVANDISNSAAAKELSEVLKQDANVRPLLNSGHFSFVLDSDFVLTIQKNS